jgi:hypothetical protein
MIEAHLLITGYCSSKRPRGATENSSLTREEDIHIPHNGPDREVTSKYVFHVLPEYLLSLS